LEVFSIVNSYPIFSVVHQTIDSLDDRFRQTFGSSFRTFDAIDYHMIATVDTKKPLFDFAADHSDIYVAAIEINSDNDDLLAMEENACKLYEIGKRREQDDQVEEEPEFRPNSSASEESETEAESSG
jgi:hypothetical protein